MNNNEAQKMVSIPWSDGTRRRVPFGTVVEVGGQLYHAVEGGFIYTLDGTNDAVSPTPWGQHVVTKVYEMTDITDDVCSTKPYISLPTNPGAIIAEFDFEGKATGWSVTLGNTLLNPTWYISGSARTAEDAGYSDDYLEHCLNEDDIYVIWDGAGTPKPENDSK